MDTLIALVAEVGRTLRGQRMMLACAESCTGGLVCATLTQLPGSSEWFDSGYITYSNEAKIHMLGVNKHSLETFGPVSEEVVRQMAEGAVRQSHVQAGLAVSGIAGPGGGTPENPVGTIWFAWHLANGKTRSKVERIGGSRIDVQKGAVIIALQGLIDILS
ncbi:MAG: CinA family protein [Pseudomonadota bacterium]|nr:CinA family protein [Pseudomonadota bacterium]